MIAGLPRLHAVTDDRVLTGDVVANAAAMAEAAGPALAVHLRGRLEGGAFLRLARELRAVTRRHGAWLVVNGRADVARLAGADALLLGRGALTVADARRVAPAAHLARSVHDEREADAAVRDGAAFLVAGHVYATPSHPDRAPAGPTLVRAAAARGQTIAIGGVTADRVPELLAAGAWGVAAIRALWDADDPAAAARTLLAALPRDETVGVVINGETRRARRGATLAGLLDDLGLDARAVVVEHNRRIVRRDALADETLADGDAIELVHFVGGG